jgi:hypothetical protein
VVSYQAWQFAGYVIIPVILMVFFIGSSSLQGCRRAKRSRNQMEFLIDHMAYAVNAHPVKAGCQHLNFVPVDSIVENPDGTRDLLANYCPDCDKQLPADFKLETHLVQEEQITIPAMTDRVRVSGVTIPAPTVCDQGYSWCDIKGRHGHGQTNTISHNGCLPGNPGGGGGGTSEVNTITTRFLDGSEVTIASKPEDLVSRITGGQRSTRRDINSEFEVRESKPKDMIGWEAIIDPDGGEVLGYWRRS